MISDADYLLWLKDSLRRDHRIVLVEAEFSDRDTSPGHGRSNFADVLNEVTSLQVNVYPNNYIDVTFTQPTSQEGYSWEVWIDGALTFTTSGGVYNFQGNDGQEYQVAVCSKRGKHYSKPWIVTFTPRGVGAVFNGQVGDWQDVGDGKGTEGTGKIYLSDFPWMSDQFIPYRDHITSEIEFEQSLDNFAGVGDFKALNLTKELDWKQLYWQGHKCTVLHGDDEWPRSKFKPIATMMIEDCRPLGGSEFIFDLMDGGQQFKRKFASEAETLTSNVAATLSYVASKSGLPEFNYYNIAPERLNYSTYIELDEESEVETVVRQIANSIGASIRINQMGGIDLFGPETGETFSITEDDIIADGVSVVESIPAVKRVVIEMAISPDAVKATTNASTGELVRTETIKTALNNFDHANQILIDRVAYRSKPHSVWAADVLNADRIQVGARGSIDSEDITGTGIVERIVRRPMSIYSTVEIAL